MTPSSIGRLSSDSSAPDVLAPGSVFAGRFRIVGLIGRGGMGEVYRADDLKLGHVVALKFLPVRLAPDRSWVERFYAEVRHARQISHPNVCRVYDVGEADGRHFLSMEYIDGEDLASLLTRIGRLPGDKALEIARQLCAGLAAAHERGVLHRDLKPANVMLDGRGRARITDFGLAVALQDAAAREVSGTPVYMAPEQLAGEGASVASDVYSLGFVLYELFTGKKPYDASTLSELRRRKQNPPAAPSAHAKDMDPAVESALLRCLETSPARRPSSALQVAAALPGGDPLAAALAAGETPSPEMVAAAGRTDAMSPAVAASALAAILGGMALAAHLSPKVYLHGAVPLEKPPEALCERAKEIVTRLGYGEKPADAAWGFSRESAYLRWVEEHDTSPDRWKGLPTGRPAAIAFWYRQSPATLVPERFRGDDAGHIAVTATDPPPTTVGMISVKLDTLGRLIRFEAVPSASPVTAVGSPTAPDWSVPFAEAGLDASAFSRSAPHLLPPSFADSRAAWVEAEPARPDRILRVEAAALQERPVFFELAGPWSRPARAAAAEPTARGKALDLLGVAIFLVLVAGSGLIARRNLRLGRGDRRGATRLAALVLGTFLVAWAFDTRHVAGISEVALFLLGATRALFTAAVGWVAYVAVEPLIRRRWPDALISWTRLLSGRVRDPLVGRAALAGSLLGTSAALLQSIGQLIRRSVETPPPVPAYAWDLTLVGPRAVAGHLFPALAFNMLIAVGLALLLLLFRALLKWDGLAAGAFALLYSSTWVLAGSWLSAPFGLFMAAASLFVFYRFGLLAWVFQGFFHHFLIFAFTTDSSAWYAGNSFFLLLVLAGVAVYGFVAAIGERPLLQGTRLED
ncbi:MAG TPA: serine/threonine-protein kinase [Thermoanaerobaculia bacterium]